MNFMNVATARSSQASFETAELNARWIEVPTMRALPAPREYFAEANVGEVAVAHEVGRAQGEREGRQAEREREAVEHCREHMRDAHRGAFGMPAESLDCAMVEAFEQTLNLPNATLPDGLLLSSVDKLLEFRRKLSR